jgi:undecaprenyl-diphosphatase
MAAIATMIAIKRAPAWLSRVCITVQPHMHMIKAPQRLFACSVASVSRGIHLSRSRCRAMVWFPFRLQFSGACQLMPDISLAHATIFGLVEGLTEFIPVSSTGHLILTGHWLGDTGEAAKVFEIFIQLGAILAVCWHYRDTFITTLRNASTHDSSRQFIASLIVAFLPAAAVGFLARKWIKAHLFNPTVVGIALVVGGVIMLLIERWRAATPSTASEAAATGTTLSLRTAFGVGVAQVLALIPGISRSGATIMGGLVLGLPRTAATDFSFFLSVPVIMAATVLDIVSSRDALTLADAPAFAVGFVVSFVSALLVVRWLLRYVARHNFVSFAWYRIVFGCVLLAILARAG